MERYYKIESWGEHDGTIVKASSPEQALTKVGVNPSFAFGYISAKPTEVKEVEQDKMNRPFRLGKSNKLAILDSNGYEVLKLPFGNEEIATKVLKLLNDFKE